MESLQRLRYKLGIGIDIRLLAQIRSSTFAVLNLDLQMLFN
jgi:hypothetical protein